MTDLHTLLQSDAVHRLGWTLLHSAWQIAALGIVVGLLLETLRRRSANARYAVACVGLVAMIAAPTATWFLLPDRADGGTASVSIPLGSNAPVTLPALSETGSTADVDRSSAASPGEFAQQGQAPAKALFDGHSSVQSTPSPAARLFQVCSPWTPWLGVGWIAGVFCLSLWNLGGWRAAQRLRRLGTSACDEPLAARVAALGERLGLHGPIRVLCSVLVDTPAVVGALRPVVLVPLGLAANMPPAQLDAILAHELAHVRRYDYLVNLLQTIIETLLFYHPAVWRLSWRIRCERENCCDDVAVTVCRKRADYAGALAAMEGLRATASPTVMAADGGSLLRRVRRIVRPQVPRPGRQNAWLAGALLVAATLACAMAVAARFDPETVPAAEDEATLGEGLPTPPKASTEGLLVPDADSPQRTREVRGRVLDHEGQPVKRATVFLGPPGPFQPNRRTDAEGRFAIHGAGDGITRLVVLSPKLHAWVTPLGKDDEELVVNLPEPATIRILFDIAGDKHPDEVVTPHPLGRAVPAGDEAQFRLQLKTPDVEVWKGLGNFIQTGSVENPGEVVLENMTPGHYDFTRTKMLFLGNMGRGVFLDRRDLRLEPGQTVTIDLTRKQGQQIEGRVLGLPDDTPQAWVYIKSAEATGDPRAHDEWKLTLFDALTSQPDGHFTTSILSPGQYMLIVHGYAPEAPTEVYRTGIRLPAYIGTAKVTIEESDQPLKARINVLPADKWRGRQARN